MIAEEGKKYKNNTGNNNNNNTSADNKLEESETHLGKVNNSEIEAVADVEKKEISIKNNKNNINNKENNTNDTKTNINSNRRLFIAVLVGILSLLLGYTYFLWMKKIETKRQQPTTNKQPTTTTTNNTTSTQNKTKNKSFCVLQPQQFFQVSLTHTFLLSVKSINFKFKFKKK